MNNKYNTTSTGAIASMGGENARSQNVERDFHRWLEYTLELNKRIKFVELSILDGDKEKVILYPTVPPAEIIKLLWEQGALDNTLFGPKGKSELKSFWHAVRNEEWFLNHPCIDHDNPEQLEYTVPIRIHGDEAKFQKVQKLIVLQWSSALSKGCAWDRFVYYINILALNKLLRLVVGILFKPWNAYVMYHSGLILILRNC